MYHNRYKILSGSTWPKHRGSSQDGARLILQEHGFENDVKYGKTKVFIRSPKTMYSLESKREESLPRIIQTMQKVYSNDVLVGVI